MRLLEHLNGNESVWTEVFVGSDETPPYAILSYAWKDDQEITFDRLINGTKGKTGYEEIRFCRQQAKHDGLRCFWEDTCCTNKSGHVELRETINSMFRWYQNAAKCCAYP